MPKKSATSLILVAGLLLGGPLLAAPAAQAVPAAVRASTASPAIAPTLIKTGAHSVMAMWGAPADNSATSYRVVLTDGNESQTQNVTDTEASFENLADGTYMVGVTALGPSGDAATSTTNTVRLGDGAATPAPSTSPSASAQPSQSPSTTPSQSTSASPSATPTQTSPTTTASPAPSATGTSGPSAAAQQSASESGLPALIAEIQPAQWLVSALVALVTFGLLEAVRALVLRRR